MLFVALHLSRRSDDRSQIKQDNVQYNIIKKSIKNTQISNDSQIDTSQRRPPCFLGANGHERNGGNVEMLGPQMLRIVSTGRRSLILPVKTLTSTRPGAQRRRLPVLGGEAVDEVRHWHQFLLVDETELLDEEDEVLEGCVEMCFFLELYHLWDIFVQKTVVNISLLKNVLPGICSIAEE